MASPNVKLPKLDANSTMVGSKPPAAGEGEDKDVLPDLSTSPRKSITPTKPGRPRTGSAGLSPGSISQLTLFSGQESPTAIGMILNTIATQGPAGREEVVFTKDSHLLKKDGDRDDKRNKGMSIWDRLKGDSQGGNKMLSLPMTDDQALLNEKEDMITDVDEGAEGKGKKFKVLARMIKNNLTWARDMSSKHEDENTAFVVSSRSEKEDSETLVFDLNNFRAKCGAYGGVTSRTRSILNKHPIERTEEELLLLKEVVARLKCFDKYPRKVKHELARVINYEHFDDGRVIIQQGHAGVSYYFIVSGKVTVKITAKDKNTGQKYTQVLGDLTEGSSFGELALLHNIKRTATIICRGHCEFLRVDKDDFESVLRVSYEREWTERLKVLSWLPQFKDWTMSELESSNTSCKLKEYPSGKVILSQKAKNSASDYIYFVVSGECRLVRTLYLGKELTTSGIKYHLLSEEDIRLVTDNPKNEWLNLGITWHPVRKHWSIGTLSRGYYFGVGAHIKDTHFIAKNRVEIFKFPRVQFIKHGRSRILEQMREDFEAAMPSNEDIYRRYYNSCHWGEYKQQVVKEVVRNRVIPSSAKITDVPLTIRMDSHREVSLYNTKELTKPPSKHVM